VIYASGSGEVISARQVGVGFEESGKLVELMAAVGDLVKAGDALARLQTRNSPESIALAISDAELNVLKAQIALDELVHADISLELAQARLDWIDAGQTLDDAREGRERMNYQRCLDSTIESYEATYFMALDKYEKLQEKYNELYAPLPETDPKRLDALAELIAAQESMQRALANLNWCTGSYTDAEIAAAEAEVALAEARLQAAAEEIERLENYPDPVDVTLAEAQLANAQARLAEAQETQSELTLLAPIDGTVLSISAVVGESIGTNEIITLADLNQPTLKVYLDETDFNSVKVGYEAEVIFDAYPGQTFRGSVTQVDPSLVSMQNTNLVSLLVQLDPDSLVSPLTLPIGLSANVDVIGGRATNAVLVPVEALRELDEGEYALFVMENNEPQLRVVEVGLIDFTYAEIVSGLEAGEIVSTGIVETQ
jgi:HlyD family secretion protein